jgi:hypothetical protein
LWTPELVA